MMKKILVVDDSPFARKVILSAMPKDRDYEFVVAANGQEGVDKYVETHPDVTFMDITMPVMDGLQALENIKKLDKNALVIMCTADIQPKSIEKAKGLGALLVLGKPPSKEAVEEALSKAANALVAVRGPNR
jgi:two-component system, chemotaxis family, chemotaxis protein CheY